MIGATFLTPTPDPKRVTPATVPGLIKIYTPTHVHTPKTWHQEVESCVVLSCTQSLLALSQRNAFGTITMKQLLLSFQLLT